jgi:two-component system response regulator PhoP
MPGKLLCVTQNPQNKQVLFESLEHGGYDVDVATDWQQAVYLSRQTDYDVALLDEQVNRDRGIDIFRVIDRQQNHLSGILCCMEPTIAHIDSAITAGVKHVLAKPVTTDELVSFVDGIVRESSRSFDDRFPNVPAGFATEEGVVKGSPALCESCSRMTSWYHKRLRLSFCSADCLSRYLSLHEF